MSQIDVIQKAAEKYRKQMATDLDAALIKAIVEAQVEHSEQPIACARAIEALVDDHLGFGDQDD